MYNFDNIVDRAETNSLKYDFAVKRGMPKDILPLWVADMDFRVPQAVQDVLHNKVDHGIFGYSDSADDGYINALNNWYQTRFGWSVEEEWLIKTPGVVFGICAAIRSLTQKGDSVLIQPPVYYPFMSSIEDNDRNMVVNQLVNINGKYCVDFNDFERKIVENDVKMFILCSPHNPVGRVWTEQELLNMGNICLKHGVIIVADEIHADFVYPGNKHLVFASLNPEFADNTITCTSPSKTFNIAGLQISNIFIKNKKIRDLVLKEITKVGYSQPNVMGLEACQAAYENGAQWLDELKEYILDNINYIKEYLIKNIPSVKLVEPQGTYLVWLNCRGLQISDEKLENIIINKAGLWLDSGAIFGDGGHGFQRINVACPRATIKQAMDNLNKALNMECTKKQ